MSTAPLTSTVVGFQTTRLRCFPQPLRASLEAKLAHLDRFVECAGALLGGFVRTLSIPNLEYSNLSFVKGGVQKLDIPAWRCKHELGSQRTHASTSSTFHLLQPNPPTHPGQHRFAQSGRNAETCPLHGREATGKLNRKRLNNGKKDQKRPKSITSSGSILPRVSSTGRSRVFYGSLRVSTGLHGFSSSPHGLEPYPFLRYCFLEASSFLSL